MLYTLPQHPQSSTACPFPLSYFLSLAHLSFYLPLLISTPSVHHPLRPLHPLNMASALLSPLAPLLSSLTFTSLALIILGILGLVIVLTRVTTSRAHARIQAETTTEEKPVPVLPYWLPYVGHALQFAWSFDDLATWGR
jgi:hypothetical protein